MKYNTLVRSNENFHASVNLQFDLNKTEKIDMYIPTLQSVLILKRYLNSFYNENYKEDNATVLIGPYGRGKSHLLLILSAILNCRDMNDKHIKNLIEKISKVDEETATLAKMIIERNRPVLPIVISCNHTNINQSFLIALKDALEINELTELFPETYFDSAVNAIELWKESYESAFKSLKKLLREKKKTVQNLIIELKQYNRDSYNLFCELYPEITNGADFNPMHNTDIVKLYMQVSEELSEQYGYAGIHIIFDEFSKFLESDSATGDMQNLKIIQDFAELASRSELCETHFCCVTHKDILDYSQSDSFRTVDGRFKKVYFVATSEQSYELVANALEHTEEFEGFFEKHKTELLDLYNNSYMLGLFNEINRDTFESIMIKCFPMHPITVYVLIRISELVGQNERTLFTFLSQSEANTLYSFLNIDFENELNIQTLDNVFDYFSELFKFEVFSPRIHSIWTKANVALKQADDDNQVKIIKAIALINIINSDVFLPVSKTIKTAVNLSDIDFNIAIEKLKDNRVITLRHDMQFAFLTPNGVNIRQSVRNYIERGLVKLDRPSVLKETYSTPYILPRQYNGDKCMMRYFRTLFMEVEDFQNYNGDFSELRNGADGLVIYLITDKENDGFNSVEKLTSMELPKNVLFCISEPWQNNDLLIEYVATCNLENEKESQDIHYKEELLLYKEDLYKSIQNIVNRIYSPANEIATYYNSGIGYDSIFNSTVLNRELSNICNEYYCSTPVINNEMINKNNLTSPLKKARVKLIDWILNHKENIPLMEGSGPEVSILRSTIMVPGLDNSNTSNDENLNNVLKYIASLITEGENRKIQISEIYSCLTASPYGMRKGIIPIYIAYVFRVYTEKIIFYYKEREIELSGDQFTHFDNNADDYYFKVEVGTKEKDDYLNFILETFGEVSENIINKRLYAVKAMQSWFRGLPKFARDHEYDYGENVVEIEKNIQKLRKNIILYDINSYHFLFEYIPEIFECEDYNQLQTYINTFFNESNSFINVFKQWLSEKLIKIFRNNIGGSLFSVMKDWYDSLSDSTRKNIFDADINIILKFINTNNDYDNEYVVSALAKSITTFAIEDWNDSQVNEFLEIVERSVEIVNNHNSTSHLNSSQNISITLNYDGETYEKMIDDADISPIAETTLNNIESVFDDYGDAITTQDKVSILLKLLRKEIENI